MKMSVREARANFASALDAAERGEHVTITKNGKPVAELGPPRGEEGTTEGCWDRNARVRKEMGLDKPRADTRSADEWLDDFNNPALIDELFGKYYDGAPDDL
jgi:prevent-host-death family protein